MNPVLTFSPGYLLLKEQCTLYSFSVVRTEGVGLREQCTEWGVELRGRQLAGGVGPEWKRGTVWSRVE